MSLCLSFSVSRQRSGGSLKFSVHADPSAFFYPGCYLLLKPLWSERPSFMPIDFQWRWSRRELDAPLRRRSGLFSLRCQRHVYSARWMNKGGKVRASRTRWKQILAPWLKITVFADCFCVCVHLHIPLTAESHWHSMLLSCPQILCSCSFPTCTALLWLFISSVTAALQSQHRFTTSHLCFCWLWAHRLLATNPKQISHIFSLKMLSTLLSAALSHSACDLFIFLLWCSPS